MESVVVVGIGTEASAYVVAAVGSSPNVNYAIENSSSTVWGEKIDQFQLGLAHSSAETDQHNGQHKSDHL